MVIAFIWFIIRKSLLLFVQIPLFAFFLLMALALLILAIIARALQGFIVAKLFKTIALVFDQTANVMIYGKRIKTVSGRIGKRIKESKATKAEIYLCNLLSWVDPTSTKHCVETHEFEKLTYGV